MSKLEPLLIHLEVAQVRYRELDCIPVDGDKPLQLLGLSLFLERVRLQREDIYPGNLLAN